jgi:hypothetical protein
MRVQAMHVRVNVVRSGKNVYRYTQVVQNYRNRHGQTVPKVLASFTNLPSIFTENLKAAIAASRDNKAVVVAEDLLASLPVPKVRANLQYLDAAVALQIWRHWRLGELLDRVLSKSDAEIPVTDMIAALTIHRCIQPSSKIKTCRWYPTSALPELQKMAPGKFNNTRVHRVLSELDQADSALQQELPRHIETSQGAFVTLFLDVTDTWFVGHGPPMASEARSKEGLWKKRIGIALLCDHRGMPLQWETLPGNYRDATAMEKLIEQVAERKWAAQAPFVMDRAMGRANTVEFLANKGVAFITAVPVDEFASYSSRIPLGAFDSVVLAGTDAAKSKDLQRLRQAAAEAGFAPVNDNCYVLDLALLTRGEGTDSKASTSRKAAGPPPATKMIRTAQAMQADLDARIARNRQEVARRYNCTTKTVRRYLHLLKLPASIQERILAGEGGDLSRATLSKLVNFSDAEQDAAFDKMCADALARPRTGRRPQLGVGDDADAQPVVRLRGVVQFNPDRFLEQRRIADEQLRELDAFVADLNRRLSSPSSHRKRHAIYAEVERELRRLRRVKTFQIKVDPLDDRPSPRWHVTLHRNDEAWRLRRQTDGLNVLVTNHDLPYSPADIVHTYFAKDQVEKDFQVIKSELDLRPLRHRTDPKVRAHVTLCMLALLIERLIEKALADQGLHMTAARCFEELGTCRLNMHATDWGHLYSVTEPTPHQTAILKALDMLALVDDRIVAENVLPR